MTLEEPPNHPKLMRLEALNSGGPLLTGFEPTVRGGDEKSACVCWKGWLGWGPVEGQGASASKRLLILREHLLVLMLEAGFQVLAL